MSIEQHIRLMQKSGMDKYVPLTRKLKPMYQRGIREPHRIGIVLDATMSTRMEALVLSLPAPTCQEARAGIVEKMPDEDSSKRSILYSEV